VTPQFYNMVFWNEERTVDILLKKKVT